MVVQYPHKIVVRDDEAAVQDASGDWVSGDSVTREIPCRAEASSGNGLVKAADGSQVNYEWKVYMPLPASTVVSGALVEIYDGAELLAKDKVKRFYRGQFNAQIWL